MNAIKLIIVLSIVFTFSACVKATYQLSNNEAGSKVHGRAVVIGVKEYNGYGYNTNKYADNDAVEISKQLQMIFGFDHVKLLMDSEASKSNIQDSLCEWLEPNESENDIVLLFFAGHGNGEYLQTGNSSRDSHLNDIGVSELDKWLNSLNSRNIVIILDSCGSGSFGDSISNSSSVILTGSTGDEKCWQGDEYGHGIFSYYIIDAFSHLYNVDNNKDYQISAEELFQYVQCKVVSEFEKYPPPSPQHPKLLEHQKEERILFNLN